MTYARARGFTLIEMLVIIAITSVVMLALTFLIQYFYKTNAYTLEQTQAVNSARLSVETAVHDLREASYGADGSYPIANAGTSTVTFYGSIKGTTAVEKVRYYLSGSTLYRGTTEPSGASYAGQPETTTLVIDNIRNDAATALFSYYDADGNQLSAPVNVAQISSVRIYVLTDVNPNRAPDVYTLVGSATLRNLHDSSQ
jgi:prepilin-type N-terminal cleavage/methylation domain-containing protein